MKKLEINFDHTFTGHDEGRNRVMKKVQRLLGQSGPIFEKFINKELKLKLRHGGSCTVVLCGEQKIQSLNKAYRQKDKKTDVLSFPIFDFNFGTYDQHFDAPMELGDIYICYPVAVSQSKKLDVSVENEIVHLIVHGFLHLLGFDHEQSSKDEEIMMKWENTLVKQIHKQWGK